MDIDTETFWLLRRLTIERTGWRRYVLGRWYHSGDACRADAANILRAMRATFPVEIGCTSAALTKAKAESQS